MQQCRHHLRRSNTGIICYGRVPYHASIATSITPTEGYWEHTVSHSRCCATVVQKRQCVDPRDSHPKNSRTCQTQGQTWEIHSKAGYYSFRQPGCGAQFPPLSRLAPQPAGCSRAASLRPKPGGEAVLWHPGREQELRSTACGTGQTLTNERWCANGGPMGTSAAAVSSSPAGGPARAQGLRAGIRRGGATGGAPPLT